MDKNVTCVNEAIKSKSEKIKALREITGSGILRCKDAVTNTDGSINKGIAYLRANGNEPNIEGISEPRWDVLDNDGKIIKSIPADELVDTNEHYKHTMRYVNQVGEYSYVK